MSEVKKIIIVDDDADDREIMRDAFIEASDAYDYAFMENGDSLLEHLSHSKENPLPALIMLDLNMPGKDGRETLKELRNQKEFTAIPIIVFTTSSSQHDKQMCYHLGANLFISKPDTFNKLVDIAKCISRLWLA